MKHTYTDPDLAELDRIWPIGQMLEAPKDFSVIVVAGAYKGRYIAYLSEMFSQAQFVGYEPQQDAYESLVLRFATSKRVQIIKAGLGTGNRQVAMGKSGTDGASVLSTSGKTTWVKLFDAIEAMPAYIDLLVLNMEGYEWALLPYLLNEMMHHRIASLAIQFHYDYVSTQAANRVIEQLSEYYHCPYSDENHWTYWRKK